MNIKEYWAKLVASGLAPDWENVLAVGNASHQEWLLSNCRTLPKIMEITLSNIPVDPYNHDIQLRKDGIDLVKLQWQKPTEADIGKMCWFYTFRDGIILCKLKSVLKEGAFIANETVSFNYTKCLLATNGRICPTIEDFEEAYK